MARELKGERLEKELARLEAMRAYEREYGDFSLICGIDEAGRNFKERCRESIKSVC